MSSCNRTYKCLFISYVFYFWRGTFILIGAFLRLMFKQLLLYEPSFSEKQLNEVEGLPEVV